MSRDVEEAMRRVDHWARERALAEDAWLSCDSDPAVKQRLRRAFAFSDKVLTGWERRLEVARERSRRYRLGLPLVSLVGGS